MKRIKAFFYIFYKSISSVEYYKEILKAPSSFSVKYLASLALVASLISTIGLSIMVVPETQKMAQEGLEQLKNVFPEDLIINVKNNEWTLNKPEPYFVAMPSFGKDVVTDTPKNLVVFDKNGTVEDVDKLDTLVLVNKVNILVKGDDSIEVKPIKEIPNGSFDKIAYTRALSGLNKVVGYIPVALVLIIFVSLYFYYFILKTMYLLIVAILLVFANVFVKSKYGFSDMYKVALHTTTLPLTIEVLAKLLPFEIPSFPSWYILMNLFFAIIVIAKTSKQLPKKR